MDMADVLRSNEGLRAELANSQRRIIELRDTLVAQQKIIADLQASARNSGGGSDDDEQPLSWFASLLRAGKLGAERSKGKRSGCLSVSCCLSVLSKAALETARFLLMGIWDFFWDPVGWWQGAKGSIIRAIETQVQILSRALGMVLLGIYLNLLALVLRRIRRIGAWIRLLGRGIWSLPLVSVTVEVATWGIKRWLVEDRRPELDRSAQLLQKMEEMTKVVRQLQSQATRAPQRSAPVMGDDRLRRPCPNCGKTGHTLVGCREPKRCLKCRSTRHLARDCPQVKVVSVEKTRGVPPTPEQVADFTCEEDLVCRVEEICREAREEVNAAEGSRAPVLHVRAGVGSSRELILLDTGSSCNVMPLSVAAAQGLDIDTESEEAQMKLRAFNGTSSRVTGTSLVQVTIGKWKATIPFLITDACSSIILGMPGLRDLDLRVDPANRRLEDRAGHLVICQRAELEAPAYSLEIASKN